MKTKVQKSQACNYVLMQCRQLPTYECMTMHELQQAMSQDQHLQHLKDYIIQGWPKSRDQIPQDIKTYWTFRDNMTVIDEVIIKGRCIVVLEAIQKQALQQLCINHMCIEKK